MKNFKLIPYLAIPILVLFLTIFRGMYHIDPHHWGLMLGNAKDVYDGKVPYKEIFIQYGFFTTLIQTAGYAISKSLIALVASSAIAYILGLVILYRLALDILKSELLAIYVVVIAFLIHPLAIYPWSNYIAFPFLVYGIATLVNENLTTRRLIIGGISLGLATLSREGLAPAIALSIALSLFVDIYSSQFSRKESLRRAMYLVAGLSLSLLLFFIFLATQGLLGFWKILSVDLPRIYVLENFSHVSGFGLFDKLIQTSIDGILNFDIRWLVITSIILVNIYFSCRFFLKNKPEYLSSAIVKISLFCLVFLTSTLHIAEIFRFSTASIVGLVSFFALLQFHKIATKVFIPVAVILGVTVIWGNTGLFYFPTIHDIQSGQTVEVTPYFSGQRWSPEKIQYYRSIDSELRKIDSLQSCKIEYLINNTPDSFIPLLSPFKSIQLAPFGVGESILNLRPDIDSEQKIKIAKGEDTAITFLVPRGAAAFMTHPGNYSLYVAIPAPNVVNNIENHELAIFLPRICFRR